MAFVPARPGPALRNEIITCADTRYFPLGQHATFLAVNLATAWTTANTAVYLPFTLWEPVTVYKIGWVNGSTASTNVDCGIYTAAGSRQISTGSTARSGASSWQWVDVADTALAAGNYYLAFNSDATTASNVYGWAAGTGIGSVIHGKLVGAQEQAVGAVALPSSASFSAWSASRSINLCGFTIRAAIS